MTAHDHKCQQFQLYGAEGRVEQGSTIAPENLQSFLDAIREHPWFERNFPMVMRIEGGALTHKATASVGSWLDPENGVGRVELLPSHLNELYVLHEISHVLAAARYGSRAHDPWFARIYLEAVYTYMSPAAYLQLQAAFRADGIDFDTDNGVPAGVVL